MPSQKTPPTAYEKVSQTSCFSAFDLSKDLRGLMAENLSGMNGSIAQTGKSIKYNGR
jgi:hypothetical protein